MTAAHQRRGRSAWRQVVRIVGALLFALALYALYVAYAAGEFRSVENFREGACTVIDAAPGAEDITFDPVTGRAWVSSDDRRAAVNGQPRPGAILSFDPSTMASPQDAWPDAPDNFHPHGISLYADASGRRTLFVISHPGEPLFGPAEADQPPHVVEVFDVEGDRLIHRTRLVDDSMISPNDLVAVDHERFYFTNDHGSRGAAMRMLEDFLRLPWANVVYYDGNEYCEVADGLNYANGINLSPDGSTLYVAEISRGRVREYRRDQNDGGLIESDRIDVGFGVDNIEVDPETGALWLGGHLKLMTFLRHASNPEVHAPSMATRLRVDGPGAPELAPKYIDDGGQLSGASVAAYRDGVLLVGSVFEGFVACTLAQ